MSEPLIEYKDDPYRWRAVKDEFDKLKANIYRATGGKFRTAFIKAARHRGTKIKLVDDAQHFGVVASGRKLIDQSNTIKSVACKAKLIIVMFGTYEMLPLRNLNGQVSRRSVNIHLKRYAADNERDREAFINVLGTLQRYLPVRKMPDCESNWEYFYERSLGCVGILKDWLGRALSKSLRNNKTTISKQLFKKTALSVAQCREILSEITQGENELFDDPREQSLLRASLSLSPEGTEHRKDGEPITKKKKPKRKPGVRNPKRDRIGTKMG